MVMNEMSFENNIVFKKLLEEYDGLCGEDYNLKYGIDSKILFDFLLLTQKKQTERLIELSNKEYILRTINEELTKKGTLLCLKEGIDIDPIGGRKEKIYLFYKKPNNNINKEKTKLSNENKFFVSRELKHDNSNGRIDVSIGVNGIHLFAVELKNGTTQTYKNAEEQLKKERNLQCPYFKHIICSFAMDRMNISMCASLTKTAKFLPFNQGKNGGAGNPEKSFPNYPVEYFWKEIMTKDSITNLIQNFIIQNGSGNIFPRYHQFRCTNKIIEDEKVRLKNDTLRNYLIAAAAGSGKTFMIVWTAYQLCNLNDADNNPSFKSVIVVSNRLVISKQLSNAMNKVDHQDGLVVKPRTSKELRDAINSGKRIIVTNMQKYPDAVDGIEGTKNSRFAVLIDEGHDSTSGEYMTDMKRSMSVDGDNGISNFINNETRTAEEISEKIKEIDINAQGKLKNATFIAFTATPKKETRENFGEPEKDATGRLIKDEDGLVQYKPFFLYSMKQAIEEGYILDVLKNYMPYELYCKVVKINKEEMLVDSDRTKKAINSAMLSDPRVIEKKTNVFMDFFENRVNDMDDNSKVMIVTGQRYQAYAFLKSFERYFEKNNLPYKAMIAFSGFLEINGNRYTENDINKLNKPLEKVFHEDKQYKFLIVADKYTTGFDEEYLSMMMVDDVLRDVKAVQTLSRLNRTSRNYPNKKTFVLDFANKYDDMKKYFSKFYTDAKYFSKDDFSSIDIIVKKVDDLELIDENDIHDAAVQVETSKHLHNDEGYSRLTLAVKRSIDRLNKIVKDKTKNPSEQIEYRQKLVFVLRNFTRAYMIISQRTVMNDQLLRDKNIYYSYLEVCIVNNTANPQMEDIRKVIDFEGIKIIQQDAITDPDYDDPDKEVGKSPVVDSDVKIKETEQSRLEDVIKEYNDDLGLDPTSKIFDKVLKFLKNNNYCQKNLTSADNFDEFERAIKSKSMDRECNVYKILSRDTDAYKITSRLSDFDFNEDMLKPVLKEIWESDN